MRMGKGESREAWQPFTPSHHQPCSLHCCKPSLGVEGRRKGGRELRSSLPFAPHDIDKRPVLTLGACAVPCSAQSPCLMLHAVQYQVGPSGRIVRGGGDSAPRVSNSKRLTNDGSVASCVRRPSQRACHSTPRETKGTTRRAHTPTPTRDRKKGRSFTRLPRAVRERSVPSSPKLAPGGPLRLSITRGGNGPSQPIGSPAAGNFFRDKARIDL